MSWTSFPPVGSVKSSGFATMPRRNISIKDMITKEGVLFANPHPSRVFRDIAYPLSSINSDTGCEYIGFWDVQRWGEIKDNPEYFNRDSVTFTNSLWNLYTANAAYFSQYMTTITPPVKTGEASVINDRSS